VCDRRPISNTVFMFKCCAILCWISSSLIILYLANVYGSCAAGTPLRAPGGCAVCQSPMVRYRTP
jgi:hypothetical protein